LIRRIAYAEEKDSRNVGGITGNEVFCFVPGNVNSIYIAAVGTIFNGYTISRGVTPGWNSITLAALVSA
jgi:hypothetical protein